MSYGINMTCNKNMFLKILKRRYRKYRKDCKNDEIQKHEFKISVFEFKTIHYGITAIVARFVCKNCSLKFSYQVNVKSRLNSKDAKKSSC